MRCRFWVACRNQATVCRYHTFLKKELNVCTKCSKNNKYLVQVSRAKNTEM